MTRSEELYARYIAGENDINKLGREYGVTRERIRQLLAKQEEKCRPLLKAINALEFEEGRIKSISSELIGKVDNDVIGEHNNLVKHFTSFLQTLKNLENETKKLQKELENI